MVNGGDTSQLVFVKRYANTSSITANSAGTPTYDYVVPITDLDKKTYGPFNSVTVFNHTSLTLFMFPSYNTDSVELVPPGATTFDNRRFYSIVLRNPSEAYDIPPSGVTAIVRRYR